MSKRKQSELQARYEAIEKTVEDLTNELRTLRVQSEDDDSKHEEDDDLAYLQLKTECIKFTDKGVACEFSFGTRVRFDPTSRRCQPGIRHGPRRVVGYVIRETTHSVTIFSDEDCRKKLDTPEKFLRMKDHVRRCSEL